MELELNKIYKHTEKNVVVKVLEPETILKYWFKGLVLLVPAPMECSSSLDCPPGYICVNGLCMPLDGHNYEVGKDYLFSKIDWEEL